MLKKLLVVLLAFIMVFSMVACGGGSEGKEWDERIIGKWIVGEMYTNDRNVFEDGILFKEDGTCIIDGKKYEWEFDEAFSDRADFYIEDDGELVYAAELYKQEGGYYTLQMAKAERDGGAVTKNFLGGLYFREADYVKVDINLNNWQDYLEFKEGEMRIDEDAFGEVTSASLSNYLVVKDEVGKVVPDMSKVAVEMTYSTQSFNYKVDVENKTYEKGTATGTPGTPRAVTLTMSNIPVGEGFEFATTAGSLHFDKLPEAIAIDDTDRKITRIEGTIYCFKGE